MNYSITSPSIKQHSNTICQRFVHLTIKFSKFSTNKLGKKRIFLYRTTSETARGPHLICGAHSNVTHLHGERSVLVEQQHPASEHTAACLPGSVHGALRGQEVNALETGESGIEELEEDKRII